MGADADMPVSLKPSATSRHTLKGVVRRLLIVVLFTYVGVSMIVGMLQARLIYFPSRTYHSTPADVGLEFQRLDLETSDGETIAAWYVPHPDAKGSVIFCHGNGGNIADRLGTIRALHHLGYNVLAFDYRGYGQSTGSPSETGTYLDAEAAWSYLTQTRSDPAERIAVFGESLGGAVAVELALRHPPGALIVQASFTSLVDIGRLHYPLLPVRWILRYRYESIGKIDKITAPKLFIHAIDDELIPLDNGRRLFDRAAPPKRFLETPGGHNSGGFTFSPAYTRQVGAFLDEALGGSPGAFE